MTRFILGWGHPLRCLWRQGHGANGGRGRTIVAPVLRLLPVASASSLEGRCPGRAQGRAGMSAGMRAAMGAGMGAGMRAAMGAGM